MKTILMLLLRVFSVGKVYATETGSVLGVTNPPKLGEVLGQNATNTGTNSILVWIAVIVGVALLIAVLIVLFRRNNNNSQ